MVLLGAHVSTAGGLNKAIENAEKIGAHAIQIFGASPRQWKAAMPSREALAAFKEAKEKSSVKAVFLHAAYLVNLASGNAEIQKKSIDSLIAHLRIAHALGADGLIFHMGSSPKTKCAEGIRRTVEDIGGILENVPGNTQLIMENSAGGGGKLCSDSDQLGEILNAVESERLKVCFDTQHAFAAGIVNEYSEECIKNVFDKWDKALGLKNIIAIHANDSRTLAGSFHDRHENLGKGEIGLNGFKNLAKEKRLHHASFILEVPGFDNHGPDKKNMDLLKECFV